MDVVNPLTGNLAQSTSVVQRQSAVKSDQVRREQALRKDVAAPGDRFEHQVESCEESNAVQDDKKEGRRGKSRRQPPPPDDQAPPRVDVVA